jgi:hypothetical protein
MGFKKYYVPSKNVFIRIRQANSVIAKFAKSKLRRKNANSIKYICNSQSCGPIIYFRHSSLETLCICIRRQFLSCPSCKSGFPVSKMFFAISTQHISFAFHGASTQPNSLYNVLQKTNNACFWQSWLPTRA